MRLALTVVLSVYLIFGARAATPCVSDKRPLARVSTEGVLLIRLDRPEISLGERAILHVQLTNASKRPLTVLETSPQREFEIHMVDSHGSEPQLTEPARTMRGMGKFPDVIFRNFPLTVEPGDVLKADEDISEAYLLTERGSYTVTVCRVVTELGPVVSNSVILSVGVR